MKYHNTLLVHQDGKEREFILYAYTVKAEVCFVWLSISNINRVSQKWLLFSKTFITYIHICSWLFAYLTKNSLFYGWGGVLIHTMSMSQTTWH